MVHLEETLLPLYDLNEQCRRFLRDDEMFPFLKLGSLVERGDYLKRWGFLEHLGVELSKDLDFYLANLSQIIKSPISGNDLVRAVELCSAIYGKYS